MLLVCPPVSSGFARCLEHSSHGLKSDLDICWRLRLTITGQAALALAFARVAARCWGAVCIQMFTGDLASLEDQAESEGGCSPAIPPLASAFLHSWSTTGNSVVVERLPCHSWNGDTSSVPTDTTGSGRSFACKGWQGCQLALAGWAGKGYWLHP